MRFEHLVLAMGALTAAGIATPASAAMDVADAMSLCSRITKADARVECYDQVARDVAAGLFQRSAPAAQGPAQAPTASSQPNWAAPPAAILPSQQQRGAAGAPPVSGFGAEAVRGATDGGPDSVRAEVASSTDNGLQQWRVRLSDGAIWQMTERVPQFRPPAPHEAVTIKKGALGGFLMDVGAQASVRVRRIQ